MTPNERFEEALVLATFDDESSAYEALSQIKTLDASSHVSLREAAVVHRDADGALSLAEQAEPHEHAGTVSGGILGALIGTLAGPIGIAVGGAVGALAGELGDYDNSEDTDSVLERIARDIPNGSTALLAALGEYGFEAVNSVVRTLGGTATRYSRADVEAEINN
jgi:uncharacterized membrane protein